MRSSRTCCHGVGVVMKPSTWTRRALLQQSAALAAGGAMLGGRRVMAQDGQPVASPPAGPAMRALSDYMSAAAARPLQANVIEKAKQHVLDTCAAMISGAELPP